MAKERIIPQMPPLLPEEMQYYQNTDVDGRFGGESGEHAVKYVLLYRGINFYKPSIDNGVDLVVEKCLKAKENNARAQVKKVVCKMRADAQLKRETGKIVKRSCFDFNLQSSGGTEKGKQRTIDDIDVFYHVLITPYRTLIWETPASTPGLVRENGEFKSVKNPALDKTGVQKTRPQVDFSKFLVYTQYDPIIYEKFPEFFKKPATLEPFITS